MNAAIENAIRASAARTNKRSILFNRLSEAMELIRPYLSRRETRWLTMAWQGVMRRKGL